MTSIKFRALTHNDHKLFFEAIGEFGKDFQNIQHYMTQKCSSGGSNNRNSNRCQDQNNTGNANKSSSLNTSSGSGGQSSNSAQDQQDRKDQDKKDDDKKREQIRNFYNKLYTKLSQLIGKLDDRVEKVTQELYLLINYGEIWKKYGFKFNNKTKRLLDELVHQGYTTLRYKNKNVRLRTPPCKALKKLHKIGIDEKVNLVTSRELPKDVIVEFRPATNRDWIKVQSISQNPRVIAKLSMQKRLTSILEFLENKWNISPDKLNRTVDAWLKAPSSNQCSEDNQQTSGPTNNIASNGIQLNGFYNSTTNPIEANPAPDSNSSASKPEIFTRIRLKPSPHHELKQVNITRVVPECHLDLSLNAYMARLGVSSPRRNSEPSNSKQSQSLAASTTNMKDMLPETNLASHNNSDEMLMATGGYSEISQGALSNNNSHLPVSLTTPDCSVLLERSLTSDQPSIAQARRNINLLQTIVGSFGGCENSRTACDDTQDRSNMGHNLEPCQRSSTGFGGRGVSFADLEPTSQLANPMNVNNSIPALIDEDAAIDTVLPNAHQAASSQPNSDSQNSKNDDFHIPSNVKLGDWFNNIAGPDQRGDDANDPFALANQSIVDGPIADCKEAETSDGTPQIDITFNSSGDNLVEGSLEDLKKNSKLELKPQDHVIEISKFAEGWTRQDDISLSVGQLFLAFKCPEKIILDYEFEQFTYISNLISSDTEVTPTLNKEQLSALDAAHEVKATVSTVKIPDSSALVESSLISNLLTAASLSLAYVERKKQEQQHRLHNAQTPGTNLKRRKVQSMSLHDIETTNQRVGEALKQLQPTRLSVFRRAR